MTTYTGRMLEMDLLPVWSGGHVGYQPFEKALALVKTRQPHDWNPSDPTTRTMNDFHCFVAEALGLEDYSELQLWDAVGSPLDHFHGTDAFFEWRGVIVTIDITKNLAKWEHKSDFVIQESTLDDEVLLRSMAELIAKRLQNRKARAHAA